MLVLQILEQRCEFGRGLCPRDPWFETGHQVHIALALHGLSAMENVGQVHIRAAPHEAGRHHSDDGPHLIVEPQLSPDALRDLRRIDAART